MPPTTRTSPYSPSIFWKNWNLLLTWWWGICEKNRYCLTLCDRLLLQAFMPLPLGLPIQYSPLGGGEHFLEKDSPVSKNFVDHLVVGNL